GSCSVAPTVSLVSILRSKSASIADAYPFRRAGRVGSLNVRKRTRAPRQASSRRALAAGVARDSVRSAHLLSPILSAERGQGGSSLPEGKRSVAANAAAGGRLSGRQLSTVNRPLALLRVPFLDGAFEHVTRHGAADEVALRAIAADAL